MCLDNGTRVSYSTENADPFSPDSAQTRTTGVHTRKIWFTVNPCLFSVFSVGWTSCIFPFAMVIGKETHWHLSHPAEMIWHDSIASFVSFHWLGRNSLNCSLSKHSTCFPKIALRLESRQCWLNTENSFQLGYLKSPNNKTTNTSSISTMQNNLHNLKESAVKHIPIERGRVYHGSGVPDWECLVLSRSQWRNPNPMNFPFDHQLIAHPSRKRCQNYQGVEQFGTFWKRLLN